MFLPEFSDPGFKSFLENGIHSVRIELPSDGSIGIAVAPDILGYYIARPQVFFKFPVEILLEHASSLG